MMNQLSNCCNAEIITHRTGEQTCSYCGKLLYDPTPPTSTEVKEQTVKEILWKWVDRGYLEEPLVEDEIRADVQAIDHLIQQAELRTLQKWEFAIEAGVNLEQQIDTIKKRINELQAQLDKEATNATD